MKLARTNIRIFCDLFPEYSNIWIFGYNNSASQTCSYRKKTPFVKFAVHDVIANLMEDSDDDDDEEVFDHDDSE